MAQDAMVVVANTQIVLKKKVVSTEEERKDGKSEAGESFLGQWLISNGDTSMSK